MTKGCVLSTAYLPRGGLPRNSVDRLTDRPDMTSAVDRGRKASTQTNNQRTNGPVNAHLTKPGKKQGQEMTLTFNTHFHLLNQLSTSTNFQATGCKSF